LLDSQFPARPQFTTCGSTNGELDFVESTSSFHPGGVNFVLASRDFIKDSISSWALNRSDAGTTGQTSVSTDWIYAISMGPKHNKDNPLDSAGECETVSADQY
jgi:hypothetical protein